MSIANFIPTVWAEEIEHELKRKYVFVEDCNKKYEGKIKKLGDSVRIKGIARPTITTVTRASARGLNIGKPEQVPESAMTMYINQLSYFNYCVDDIDQAQADGDIKGSLQEETTEGLANAIDKHVAKQVLEAPKLFKSPIRVVSGVAQNTDEMNVLDILDLAIQKIQENDIPDSAKVTVTISPAFEKILKKAWREIGTNNTEIMEHGKIGIYSNVVVRRSNNVYRENDVNHIMIRTQRAIAFAEAVTEVKAYEPEETFQDAVKGFALYDAKVVRPKEIFDINVICA